MNTKTKKTIVIVVVAIVGALSVLFGLGFNKINSDNTAAANLANQIGPDIANQPPAVEEKIQWILGNDANRINDTSERQVALEIIQTGNTGDTAKLIIESGSPWTATIQDSDFVQKTIDGKDTDSIEFKCSNRGTYSAVVQVDNSYYLSGLNAFIAQNGKILKQSDTTADFGIVSLAGMCGV